VTKLVGWPRSAAPSLLSSCSKLGQVVCTLVDNATYQYSDEFYFEKYQYFRRGCTVHISGIKPRSAIDMFNLGQFNESWE